MKMNKSEKIRQYVLSILLCLSLTALFGCSSGGQNNFTSGNVDVEESTRPKESDCGSVSEEAYKDSAQDMEDTSKSEGLDESKMEGEGESDEDIWKGPYQK